MSPEPFIRRIRDPFGFVSRFLVLPLLAVVLIACEDEASGMTIGDQTLGGLTQPHDCVVVDRSTEEVLPGVWLTWDSSFLCTAVLDAGNYAVTITVANEGSSDEAVWLDRLDLSHTTPRPRGQAPAATAEVDGLPVLVARGERERFTVRGRYELVTTDEGAKANLHFRASGHGGTSSLPFQFGVNLLVRGPGAVEAGAGGSRDQVTQLVTEGCTHGFWKNNPGAIQAAAFDPNASFEAVVGVDLAGGLDGISLIRVLDLGGGGVHALLRHAVAALLNAAHPTLDFRFTEAEVVIMVRDALRGWADIEQTKDILETANEQGCPLEADEAAGRR
jgi:hypothetical protein